MIGPTLFSPSVGSRLLGGHLLVAEDDADGEGGKGNTIAETNPNRIDPEGFYSEGDVLLRFAVGYEQQKAERNSGRLKAIEKQGTYIYRGSDLISWLNGPSGQQAQAETAKRVKDQPKRRRGVSSRAQTGSSAGRALPVTVLSTTTPASVSPVSPVTSGGKLPVNTDENTIRQFNTAVSGAMRENGGDRRAAIRSVCKGDPGLHRAYLLATNRDKARSTLEQL